MISFRPCSHLPMARPTGQCTYFTSSRSSRKYDEPIRCSSAQPGEVTGAVVRRSELLKGALLLAAASALGGSGTAVALEQAEAGAAVLPASSSLSKVVLRTLQDCQLAVSVYPTFDYNAEGGNGSGTVTQLPNGLLRVVFDPATLQIPPIQNTTTSILGVPIPPPLKIEIRPQKLSGTVDPATGQADLEFLADFRFSAAPLYRAAPLVVSTTLTSEASEGVLRRGEGARLSGDGRARLVGVARVPTTGDAFLDNFLMLPTDALAVLSAELEFS